MKLCGGRRSVRLLIKGVILLCTVWLHRLSGRRKITRWLGITTFILQMDMVCVKTKQKWIFMLFFVGCASMLIEFHRFSGYANEIDLFIAQAVLQYLCLRNKSTAKLAFNSYTTQHPNLQTGPPYFLPLLNFIWFLLQAIEG